MYMISMFLIFTSSLGESAVVLVVNQLLSLFSIGLVLFNVIYFCLSPR